MTAINKCQKIGEYLITKKIGFGSFGAAYTCYKQESPSETFVLKQIELRSLSTHDTQCAIQESELLRKLSSPCIVKYIDSFVNDMKLSIVMEYCDGGDLESLIKQRKESNQLFLEKEIKTVLCQIAIALEYCHHQNIVHRDIKTANIFLCANGRVKLGDFGVSKELRDSNSMAETQIGTPYYLSPEICKGEPYNSKSDIWALGCIIYEMLNLHRPFDGPHLASLVMNIANGKYQPLSPKFSDPLRSMVIQMLNQSPEKRISATEIITHDAMQTVFDKLSILRKIKETIPEKGSRPKRFEKISQEVDSELLKMYEEF